MIAAFAIDADPAALGRATLSMVTWLGGPWQGPPRMAAVRRSGGSAMGRFVIVAYTPKPGQEEPLLAAIGKHLQVLRAEQLVTDKPAYVMLRRRWHHCRNLRMAISQRPSSKPTATPRCRAWGEFGSACDYTPLTRLAETHQMFAEFDAVEL